jgi:hypothetical protein
MIAPAAVIWPIVIVLVIAASFHAGRRSVLRSNPAFDAVNPLTKMRVAADPRYRFLGAHIGEAGLAEMGKDVFHIRLSEKVSTTVLKDIAPEVVDNKPPNPSTGTKNGMNRMFFYLPEVDAYGPGPDFGIAWATVHFDRTYPRTEDVAILGLTIDEEKNFLAKRAQPRGTLNGKWIEDSVGKTMHIIYRRDGVVYLNDHLGNWERVLAGLGPEPLRLFRLTEPTSGGDYFQINERGDLEIHDGIGRGLVSVARRLGKP